MKRVPRLVGGVAVGATTGLAAALVLAPGNRTAAAAAYALALGVIGLAALARAIVRVAPAAASEFERALVPPRTERQPIRELTRLENDVIHGTESARDFRARLAPVLRAIAADRLAAHHGVDLEANAETARRILGDAVWDALRSDPERFPHGLPRAQLERAVERLEPL